MKRLKEFLTDLPDLGIRLQSGMQAADFTLERMEWLMEALRRPEHGFHSIHIAGTNGKGSVAAFCSAVLQAQGYKVGRFTSPHIQGALAGISINGQQVGEEELQPTFETLLKHLETRADWTQFEVVTALMFQFFAQVKVDSAVIEVGLGGRLDATNVLTPTVSVITPIDYDHTSILGRTLSEIAQEKAGIIKPDVPLALAPQPEQARRAILKIAEERHTQVIEVGKDMLFEKLKSDLTGQEFDVWLTSVPEKRTRMKISLLGSHQIENAVTAYASLQLADQRRLKLDDQSIRSGFAAARWPGRFEVLHTDPPVVLDAAHSPAAAKALRAALDEYFPDQSTVVVIGVSTDKNLQGIIEPLHSRIAHAIATQSPHTRAMSAEELSMKLKDLGIVTEVGADAIRAVEKAMRLVKPSQVILICGSVFLVEMIHDWFVERNPVDG